jgi:alkanesulfonate monooxygenase SsuD/methylene tetrahydromethanopterin reductase-like flavin-dependent oxidoreductase (luciferase family)
MRVGISIGTTFDAREATDAPGWVLAQTGAAAGAGLDSLTVGDHHSTGPGVYLQNVPLIGRILGTWHQRPVGCLFLVPLWHPVLMAEQIGTLAAIAAAPFIIQVGVGAGQAQFAAMGRDLGERGARTERGIRIVQALLEGDTVDDEEWDIKAAHIAPLPPEGTEWWIAGGVPRSIDRAARLGTCWYGNADLTVQSAARAIELYRDACARHDVHPGRIPIRKDVFIAEDRAEAERLGDSLIDAGYRGFERGAVAYGDPQSVAEQLAPFGDLGFTDVIIRTMTRGGSAVRTVALAGELRAILAGTDPGTDAL